MVWGLVAQRLIVPVFLERMFQASSNHFKSGFMSAVTDKIQHYMLRHSDFLTLWLGKWRNSTAVEHKLKSKKTSG